MQFPIDGVFHEFIDIRTYRSNRHLPTDFGVNTFEPKSYEGLGSMASAGEALRGMKEALLAELPAYPTPHQWLLNQSIEQERFHRHLLAVNPQVGLRESEIDFAVAGYVNAYSQWVYALIHAASTRAELPPFENIYRDWLYQSIRIAHTVYPYTHEDETWDVQIVAHVYGRIGLQIQHNGTTDYVYDHTLACPAERFMEGLLTEVAMHIRQACGL